MEQELEAESGPEGADSAASLLPSGVFAGRYAGKRRAEEACVGRGLVLAGKTGARFDGSWRRWEAFLETGSSGCGENLFCGGVTNRDPYSLCPLCLVTHKSWVVGTAFLLC